MEKTVRAIEWAEYVLPIWEKYYPNDNRPRKVVEAAKANAAPISAAYAADSAAASDAAATAAYTASSAAYAAPAVARAGAHAAYAAYAAYAASDAAHVAYAAAASAARAILLEGYGEDIVKVRKVLLLKEFIDFYGIKWIDYKPEQFWDAMLEKYCSAKSCAAIENEATKL